MKRRDKVLSPLRSALVGAAVFLYFMSPSFAVSPSQIQSSAMDVFQEFLSCRDQMLKAQGREWLKCMDPHVVKAQFRKDAFARFLMSTEVTRVRGCTKQDEEVAKGFPGFTEHSVCFEFLENANTKAGMAFFVKVKGEMKLFSLLNTKHI